MKSITVDQVMAWKPCGCDGVHDGKNYTRQRVSELFNGRDALTAQDIASLPIPTSDKLWVFHHPFWLPQHQFSMIACDYAEHVLCFFEKQYPDDHRLRAGIEALASVAGRRGSGDALQFDQLADAAYDAYADGADAATAYADAAYDAYADGAAAYADAAYDAEREWQLQRLLEYLQQEDT